MDVNEVFEKVKGLFVEELGIDSEKITMDAKARLNTNVNRRLKKYLIINLPV